MYFNKEINILKHRLEFEFLKIKYALFPIMTKNTINYNDFYTEQRAKTNWCWAAVAQAVKIYANGPIEQCTIAHDTLIRTGHINKGNDCCRKDEVCNIPANLIDALNEIDIGVRMITYSYSYPTIKSFLDNNNLIAIRTENGNTGHYLLMLGANLGSDDKLIYYIFDPANNTKSAYTQEKLGEKLDLYFLLKNKPYASSRT